MPMLQAFVKGNDEGELHGGGEVNYAAYQNDHLVDQIDLIFIVFEFQESVITENSLLLELILNCDNMMILWIPWFWL